MFSTVIRPSYSPRHVTVIEVISKLFWEHVRSHDVSKLLLQARGNTAHGKKVDQSQTKDIYQGFPIICPQGIFLSIERSRPPALRTMKGMYTIKTGFMTVCWVEIASCGRNNRRPHWSKCYKHCQADTPWTRKIGGVRQSQIMSVVSLWWRNGQQEAFKHNARCNAHISVQSVMWRHRIWLRDPAIYVGTTCVHTNFVISKSAVVTDDERFYAAH